MDLSAWEVEQIILEEIREEDESVKLQKGRELSFLEVMQRNKKIYKMNKRNVRNLQADNKEEGL